MESLTIEKWLEFLKQWRGSISKDNFPQSMPWGEDVSERLIRLGAAEAQIAKSEARLGMRLPPSYRSFLEVSNGLALPGDMPVFLPVEEIGWLRDLDPEAIRAWMEGVKAYGTLEPVPDEEYFVYGERQNPSSLRHEYLQTALQVSDQEQADTAVYLLNPQVIDEQGEWEAWSWAHWKAGADRYRSFWELMQAEYHSYLSAIELEANRIQPGDDLQTMAVKLPELLHELQEKAAMWGKLVEQSNEMGDPWGLGYNQGVLEGLHYAERRVSKIGAKNPGLENLRDQLKILQGELEEKWQKGVKAVRGPNLMDLIKGGINTVHLSGTAEGYREALGILKWYLHEN